MSSEHFISVPCLFFQKQQFGTPQISSMSVLPRATVQNTTYQFHVCSSQSNILEHHIPVPCLFFPEQYFRTQHINSMSVLPPKIL